MATLYLGIGERNADQ